MGEVEEKGVKVVDREGGRDGKEGKEKKRIIDTRKEGMDRKGN